MKNLKCPSCGAPVKGPDDNYCEFCGAYLVDDESHNNTHDEFSDTMKNIGHNIMGSFENITSKINEETSKAHVDKNFNWVLFLILMFFCAPVGIIYLIFNLVGAER